MQEISADVDFCLVVGAGFDLRDKKNLKLVLNFPGLPDWEFDVAPAGENEYASCRQFFPYFHANLVIAANQLKPGIYNTWLKWDGGQMELKCSFVLETAPMR